jgi:hypothetical protein
MKAPTLEVDATMRGEILDTYVLLSSPSPNVCAEDLESMVATLYDAYDDDWKGDYSDACEWADALLATSEYTTHERVAMLTRAVARPQRRPADGP